ncbi:hypothetical protein MNBD_NITROSPINAE03-729 [hydrothermal vent metagenome]|uniref:Radical SAM core domain-containing protein n=1 Tax=hydrothermal vent metagenome TaxID=652676 RepID=A0A3B1CM97_9ZZZZ
MKPISFYETWLSLNDSGALDKAVWKIENATLSDVDSALLSVPVSSGGFLSLVSDMADERIERIETSARDLTIQRFGHTVNLYIPLYLSNYCVNNCSYCWFQKENDMERKTLTLDEIEAEGRRLLNEGYRNVLLVAGESKAEAPLSYIAESVKLMKKIGFVFVGIETQTFTVDEYKLLGAAGLDSVTVYQETYDEKTFKRVHPSGPKKDIKWRIDTADRVARAGIRSIGLGVLLGLGDYRRDAVMLATHVKHMQKHYWQNSVSISFPRIHAVPSRFAPDNPVSDNELIRLILAMRLTFPDSILTLSTREPAKLRDRLFGAGINQVSAGSKTSPGAYAGGQEEGGAGEQFPVSDSRTPAEVVSAIREKGLEWVWKDWDTNLKPVS